MTTLDIQKIARNGLASMQHQLDLMSVSRFHSWTWTQEDFASNLDWILQHPHEIRTGYYLSDTLDKEVWRISIPNSSSKDEFVYKIYHESSPSFLKIGRRSPAAHEILNYATLHGLGIPVAPFLACGETRHYGKLFSSFVITKYISDAIDGSALMPGGNLSDQSELRMAFSKKSMEIIARAHSCLFLHTDFHPNKILIASNSTIDNQDLTLIDVSLGHFVPPGAMPLGIARDLVSFFIDMRLHTEQIKFLCSYYLQFNTACKLSADALWEELIHVSHNQNI